jgi:hypothetical protein
MEVKMDDKTDLRKLSKSGQAPLAGFSQDQAKAAVEMQRDLLAACEKASSAWLARMQSEVDLWFELATELSATRSAPDAFAAYTKCASQRVQMAADDGLRLLDDCQQVTQKLTQSLTNARTS